MILSTKGRHFASHRFHGKNSIIVLIFLSVAIFSTAGWSVCVESFLLASPLTATVAAISTPKNGDFEIHHQQTIYGQLLVQSPSAPRKASRYGREPSSKVILKSSEDDTNTSGSGGVLESIGLVSQPIVWISLYFLATTGHGLPAGPGGSIGATEGIAYLVVVVLALSPVSLIGGSSSSSNNNDGSLSINARTLSRITIVLGLLVLVSVAAGKGCVPNAKPILDYSAYLPICGAE